MRHSWHFNSTPLPFHKVWEVESQVELLDVV